MVRKDKNDNVIFKRLINLNYTQSWGNYSDCEQVSTILKSSSKNGKGNNGYPDYVYTNINAKLLIMIEVKPSISQHVSSFGKEDAEKYAVDGIKHYLNFFLSPNFPSEKMKEFFLNWKIIGLAISGDPDANYNHRISTFLISNDNLIEQKGITDILDENDYLNLFENIDEEKIISDISSSSKKINRWLRSVDSQKRPILLSALMICLFEVKDGHNDFRSGFNSWSSSMIITNIPFTLTMILSSEKIPTDKIELIKGELAFINHDQDLNNTDLIKEILNELRDFIIPLFKRKSNYDIIGKFYEEFLRYAGVANVKKGIVLTPRHITTLFTDLIDVKVNDVFLDPACGTGAFLISAMNRLVDTINASNMPNKDEHINNLKSKQLIGFEKNATMYALAISNMLFRGDGKSQIFYNDFFSKQADDELKRLRRDGITPTIGFVNPPYGGKDNNDNPTKKEIQFLTKMLDNVSRYGIMIAPLSTFFKDEGVRNSILTRHTLKFVINMPKDLFMPNAATNTAVAVFETNKPHGDQSVVFYDLKDDGFVLSKAKGRTDTFNKWNRIKHDLLKKINDVDKYIDNIKLVKTTVEDNDEWLIQAHSKTDYSKLSNYSFVKRIKEYLVYKAKKEMNLFEVEMDELSYAELILSFYGLTDISDSKIDFCKLDISSWKEFVLKDYFDMFAGRYYPAVSFTSGNTPLVSASDKNNGVMQFTDIEPIYKKDCITIGKVGMSVFYQPDDFVATSDVTVLVPKFKMNTYIALFLVTVIEQENYKWSYGRQIRLNDSQQLRVILPHKDDKPDWDELEKYILTLPYSQLI